jgi:four helix bundle protein
MIPWEKLRVGDRAHAFALAVYRETASWSDRILMVQLRRSALSVPSNFAEGAARESQREFARFIGIAYSSAAEAQYQLRFSHDLGLLPADRFAALSAELREIQKMTWRLLEASRANDKKKVDGRR